jgi:hypothetical protein
MNNLLLDDKPLVVIPSLAVAIGLEEAIVLQQLHYWLLRSKNERDGRKWVYNTLAEWREQFPFWSPQTIRRVLNSLREKEVVITANYNQMNIDRTLWYTIDYDFLSDLLKSTNGNVEINKSMCRNQQTNNQETSSQSVVVVDKTPGDVFAFFENNMPGSMTDFIAKALGELIDTYGPGEVHTAIEKALLANVRKLNYIEQILVNRAAGKDKPQKDNNNGSNRRAGSGSTRPVSSANAAYVIPGT